MTLPRKKIVIFNKDSLKIFIERFDQIFQHKNIKPYSIIIIKIIYNANSLKCST